MTFAQAIPHLFFSISFKNIVLQMNEAVGHFKNDSKGSSRFCTRARLIYMFTIPPPCLQKNKCVWKVIL